MVTTEAKRDTAASLPRTGGSDVNELIAELTALKIDLVATARMECDRIALVHPSYRDSALNLLHFLALRRHDVRGLQDKLTRAGLSSLGRSDAHILDSVSTLISVLNRLVDRHPKQLLELAPIVDADEGRTPLSIHTEDLMGPRTARRSTKIMVTMPSEAADDPTLVHNLIANGMDVMRINCAHDGVEAWGKMIANLRIAEKTLDRRCLVSMDLAGPKLRTGPVTSGPEVVRLKPHRDDLGRVTRPARVWLATEDRLANPPVLVDAQLPVPADWVASLRIGSVVKFTDARGRHRRLTIVTTSESGCVAETDRTAYVTSGTCLSAQSGDGSGPRIGDAVVGPLPPLEQSLTLKPGDRLVLTRDLVPGTPAINSEDGATIAPARIGCTLPEVFGTAKPGQVIWFDDGKIGGTIESVDPDEIVARVTAAAAQGAHLRAEKGINLPDTRLSLPAITSKDESDLAFAAIHADMVALSFVQTAADIEAFYRRLDDFTTTGHRPGLVLKIETRRAFENLPALVLSAMTGSAVGIMIARGDLAVECGFERLAEVQEEILWLAEAAHLPVIWATQVLETEAQSGFPTRAEITDAAMSQRAECVMLNKGPYIVQAVRTLDNILVRMSSHQDKKRPLLRRLHAWDGPAA